MENWSRYKTEFLLIITISALISAAFTSFTGTSGMKKWGFYGHKRINRMAIFTLPPEMFGFYKDHIEYITEHAVDPDKRRYAVKGEAECHYIDIDHYTKYGEDPFEVVPRSWNRAAEKFSEDTLRAYGIVPWHIQVVKRRLQRAFEAKNTDLILKYSSDLGHYIADAHVPLHTTENYNGLMTGQRGIHGLWESRLVELNMDSYDYFVGKSRYIEDPLDYAWHTVRQSHYALDSVFRFEKDITREMAPDKKYAYEQRGNQTIQTYSVAFSQEYHRRLNGMVERRMRQSVIAVGSFWYTAWVDAGQPDLTSLQRIPPSAQLLKELNELDDLYKKGNVKGRDCEH